MGGASQLRKPLGAELDKETFKLQLLTTRLWQLMTALGMLVALVVAQTVSPPLGVACGISCLVMLCWFTAQHELLRRGRARLAITVVSTLIESAIPWALLLIISEVQGARYALGSWVPPLLFAMILVVSTVRLQPWVPIILGLSAGIAFPTLYFLVVREQLSAEAAALPLYQPVMQLTRGASFALGGALCALASRHLRGAIGRADKAARARELFGKYRLKEQIGSGGMGIVFEALYCPEGGFERPVAVKRIHPHLAAQDRFVNAFRLEAELSARLVHPNIVQVLDFGRIEGSYFLAMEFVEGITLRGLMRRMRRAGDEIELEVVAYIARELLTGLSFSHATARGVDGGLLRVVHRDLCPANVLLSCNGEVKISDFGVARALRGSETSETKTVAGHAAYMSPEQAWGDPVDERCDLFAVAVIVWELLCGRRLFSRASEAKTFFAVVNDRVLPPSELREGLSRQWDSLVGRGLAKDASVRFTSAAEMTAALAMTDVEPIGPDIMSELVSRLSAVPEPEDGPDDIASGQELPTHIVRAD